MIPSVLLRWAGSAQHELWKRTFSTATQQVVNSASAVGAMRGVGEQQQQEQQRREQQLHIEDPMQFQASLATRVQQINLAISQLQPKSASLKDPQARRQVEKQLKDLARQGLFISEASRELDAILMERGRAW